MEFPERLTRLERGLAALLLAAAAVLCGAEAGSSLAAALRQGRPWIFWLTLSPEAAPSDPRLFLSIYHPRRRSLDLVHVPGPARQAGDLALDLPPDLGVERAPTLDGGAWAAPVGLWTEPPAAAKSWLLARGTVPRAAGAGGLGFVDRLLLGLELRRIAEDAVRPAWLAEKEDRRNYFDGLLSPRKPGEAALTVEVFNASPRKGLASQATKVLRWRGADVVGLGNAAAPAERTFVYDRTGRFENAAAAREMMGCRAAEAVTRIEPKRLVDVTIVLAEDCAQAGEPEPGGSPWN